MMIRAYDYWHMAHRSKLGIVFPAAAVAERTVSIRGRGQSGRRLA
jgi:hypothetical protein